MTEDEMTGWLHRLSGHELEQTLGNSEGQGTWCAVIHGLQGVGHGRVTEHWLLPIKQGTQRHIITLKGDGVSRGVGMPYTVPVIDMK